MSSMQSNEHSHYFVPGFGISRHIIFSHINFFLGPYASCRSYSYHGREGYLITGPQLTKVFAPASACHSSNETAVLAWLLTVITEPNRRFADPLATIRAGSSREDVEYEWIQFGRSLYQPTCPHASEASVHWQLSRPMNSVAWSHNFQRPCSLLMLSRLDQTPGRTSFRKGFGIVEGIRLPLPCFILLKIPGLTNGKGGRSVERCWSGSFLLLVVMGLSYGVYYVSIWQPYLVLKSSKKTWLGPKFAFERRFKTIDESECECVTHASKICMTSFSFRLCNLREA